MPADHIASPHSGISCVLQSEMTVREGGKGGMGVSLLCSCLGARTVLQLLRLREQRARAGVEEEGGVAGLRVGGA